MIRTFFRDSAIYAFPTFLSSGLSLLLIPLYTRVLSTADYGTLDMLLVFGNLITLTVSLEVSQGVARYYTDEQNKKKRILYASTALWFSFFCYTLFLIFSLLFSATLSRLVIGKTGLEYIFQIGLFYIWLNGLYILIHNQFRWELRSKNYAIISILVLITTVSISVTLAYFLNWGLLGILYGNVMGVLVGCVYGLWYLRGSFRFCFQMARLKEMLIFSAPLVPSGISVFVSLYIDRLMINHYFSLDEVGIYGIGFRLASVVNLVMVGFSASLTPLIYANYQKEQTPAQLARLFRIFIGFSLLAFLGLSIFAREIMWIMTTPKFYSGSDVVIFLVPAILLSNMYIFAPGMDISRKTHYILWINLAGAVSMTILNWLLIPFLGVIGAAVAKLLGYAGVFSTYMIISQRLYHVPHEWKTIIISLVISVCLVFGGCQMDIGIIGNIFIKVTLVVGAFVLFTLAGLFRWSEIEKAYYIVRQRCKYGPVMKKE